MNPHRNIYEMVSVVTWIIDDDCRPMFKNKIQSIIATVWLTACPHLKGCMDKYQPIGYFFNCPQFSFCKYVFQPSWSNSSFCLNTLTYTSKQACWTRIEITDLKA